MPIRWCPSEKCWKVIVPVFGTPTIVDKKPSETEALQALADWLNENRTDGKESRDRDS